MSKDPKNRKPPIFTIFSLCVVGDHQTMYTKAFLTVHQTMYTKAFLTVSNSKGMARPKSAKY